MVLFSALLTDKGALLLLGQAFVNFIDVVPSLVMTSEVLTTKRAVKSDFHVNVFHVYGAANDALSSAKAIGKPHVARERERDA